MSIVITVPATSASKAPPSRRQEHKLRTQRGLQTAALDLFAEQGYDDTTTDEIAERAGVSPRTFFRYFPTKESVLFVGEYGWFQSFNAEFLAQPAELTDFEALRQALLNLAPGLHRIRRAMLLYEKATASSPTLRGGVHDRFDEDVATMAEAIATRRELHEADDGCVILATVVLMMYRRALKLWLVGPASADPRDLIIAGLDTAVAEMAQARPTARRRAPLQAARRAEAAARNGP